MKNSGNDSRAEGRPPMTIKDLAAKTGYAVGTVSRALNHQPNVSEKARQAILEAARESGFQLNQNAKQLKQVHSTNILVVIKGTRNELFAELLEVIQAQVAATRYSLVVDYMDENENEVHRALQLIQEKKPLGILFLGGNEKNFLGDFSSVDVPSVLVTSAAGNLPFANLSSVCVDDRTAARQAMETLIALGHRRIALIGGMKEVSDISRLRYEGCLDAFRAHEIPFDPEKDYLGVKYNYSFGYQAAMELLDRGRDYTAIFAGADVLAIGAIRALRDRGLRVPEDVSVMGFDGLPVGDFLVPRLATVVQSRQELGKKSVEILLAAIEQGEPARHQAAAFTVLPRESIKKL